MTATNQAQGFVPVLQQQGGGTVRPFCLPGGIPTGYATAIYSNQPVKYTTTGVIAPVAAATDGLLGAFIGVQYTDANGRPQFSNQWVASTTATDIRVWYTLDPGIEYEIQGDGPVARAAIGDQANFSNLTANGAGLSQCTMSATLKGATNTGQLTITGLSLMPGNDWGDAYTLVRVKIAAHQLYPTVAAI